MVVARRIVGSLAVFGLATAFMIAAGAPASAQSTFQTTTTINPPPSARAIPQRSRGLPLPRPNDAAETRTTGRPSIRGASGRSGTLGAGSPEVSNNVAGRAPGQAGGGPQTLRWRTIVPADGSTASPTLRGATSPTDTDASGESGEQSADNESSTVADQRSDADRAPFSDPPAGFDPNAFSSEISPILDRRPRQLARFEPYQPTGIRAGSFVILPEVEIGGAYYSNILNTPSKRSDRGLELRPSIRVVSNWRRHAAEINARADLGFLDEFDSEDERAYRLESRGRLDVTRRTNIESLFAYDVSQESRGTAESAGGAAERSGIVTTTSAVTLNHRFNRLRVQLRGGLEDQDAENVDGLNGATIINDDRDYRQASGAARLSWEFKPTLFVFSEVEVLRRNFERAAVADGIERDSKGQRYRAGLAFGNSSELLRGEISIGFGREDLDDRRLNDVEGVLVDANLAWRPTRLTSVLLTASSDIATTRIAGSGGARDNNIGVEVRHAPRRNLITSAGLVYDRRDYDGISLLEQTWTANAGVEYFANRNLSLFSRYTHTWFNSSAQGSDYEADEFRVGMRLRR